MNICESDFRLDIHTHTIASGHAYGTIREMAAAAAEKKLTILGISEHGPGIPGTCETIYFSNLRMAPHRLCGVNILYGCEINVLNGGRLSLTKYVDRLDYGIVGIHCQCYENEGAEGNTKNLVACMKDPHIFFVSHPDDNKTPLDYRVLVRAALQYHVALEVNNSSLIKRDQRLGCVENYREMLALCREYCCPVIVNSDAHGPAYIGRFTEAVALLNEVNFPSELILNTDIDRFLSFIGKKK